MPPDWPHAAFSTHVETSAGSVHVQSLEPAAAKPRATILFLHGSGASTHSWRDVMTLAYAQDRAVALDLPGHGFSGTRRGWRPNLPAVAQAVGDVLERTGTVPDVVVGHSAGAAVAARLALDAVFRPAGLVFINGALEPFPGSGSAFFSLLGTVAFLNPLTPYLISRAAGDRTRVERLMRSTGSHLSQEGLALYQRLLTDRRHVEGTFAMMLNWDVRALRHALDRLDLPVLQIVGGRDATVPPAVASDVQALLPHGQLAVLPNHGHLVHEEAPEQVWRCIDRFTSDL